MVLQRCTGFEAGAGGSRKLDPERPSSFQALAHSVANGGQRQEILVAVSSAYGNTLASNGAAAAQHSCSRLGLHARPESVRFDAAAAVGLKCALWH